MRGTVQQYFTTSMHQKSGPITGMVFWWQWPYKRENTVPILSYCSCLSFYNTIVSNHFHSVKILLFSSARSCDFDGLIGIELPVSMYTTKTPIDMCCFNVRSSTLKNLNIFCKREISIKLFYLYQRLQCRDKYFFRIKFVFFLYLRLSASSAFMYIFLISDRQWGTKHQYLFISFLGISILQLLIIYRIYDYDMLTLSQ